MDRIPFYRARGHCARDFRVKNVQRFQQHGCIIAVIQSQNISFVFFKERKTLYHVVVAFVIYPVRRLAFRKHIEGGMDQHHQHVFLGRIISVERRARHSRELYYFRNGYICYISVLHERKQRVRYLFSYGVIRRLSFIHLKQISLILYHINC